MPDPWFRAQAFAGPMYGMDSRKPDRDLLPGERILGPFILPPFQRPPVWSQEQRTALVESLWDGVPIGAYVVNQTTLGNPCDQWLLDGQQRIGAILGYIRGEFPVYGHLFTDLDRPEQLGFLMRPLAYLETNIETEAHCRLVYNRLAFGGTAHTPDQRA